MWRVWLRIMCSYLSFSKRTNLKSILTINKEKKKGRTERSEGQTGRGGEGGGNKALEGERKEEGREERS